jgi:adenylate cyclase
MGTDEVGTLDALRGHRRALVDPAIAEHHGRIVKTTGDGMLVEFASVVDAVACSVAVQRGMLARNAEIAENRHLVFRIGINLGDVIVEGDDILGDGVNVAARLESLAPPGGLCVSDAAVQQLGGRLDIELRRLGPQRLKNIAEPVIAWAWHLDPARLDDLARWNSANDRPAVAVLPLLNLSATEDGEFFADGLTEDIITQLSRVSGLHVTARGSVFAYKGRGAAPRDVGRDLGVRYVVEGSVRRAGSRVRVTVQLVDAGTGQELWAERYDRELADIFQLQDDISAAIVGTLPGRLEAADLLRVARKPPADLAAYDYLLRGKIHHHRVTREDNRLAMAALARAIALDAALAPAHAWQGCVIGQAVTRGWVDNPAAAFAEASSAVNTALTLDENDIEAQRVMCEIRMLRRDWDAAEHHHARALALCPNDARIVAQHGELLLWAGQPNEAIPWIQRAMQLDPYEADRRARLLGRALYAAGRDADAARALRRVPAPDARVLAELAAACAMDGLADEAARVAEQLREVQPAFNARAYAAELPYRREADRARLTEGMAKAGVGI